MKLATISAVRLAAALVLSAGFLSVACHQRAGLPAAPAPPPDTTHAVKSAPPDPGQPPVFSSPRALRMHRFREATQRAIEQGVISPERGAELIELYEAHLKAKKHW